MNIALIKENILQTDGIKPIGKTIIVDGIVCHVMGFALQSDGVLKLLILEYDDEYRNKREQAELDGVVDTYIRPATNRDEQKGAWRDELRSHFLNVEKICFGEQEYTVKGGNGQICSISQWEMVVLFTRFLDCGWNPSGIDVQNLDYIYLTSISFDGMYRSIPNIASTAAIRFSMRPLSERNLAEIPITLTIRGEYTEKLFFSDTKNKRERWLQINDVYLYDLWEYFDKLFADPRMKEIGSENEIKEQKSHTEKIFLEQCPKGMCFVAIDYECEDDVSVQFFSKRWLDAEPSRNRSGTFGIIGKPDKPTGKLGMKLRTAFINEPFSPETKIIESELFGYYVTVASGDILV